MTDLLEAHSNNKGCLASLGAACAIVETFMGNVGIDTNTAWNVCRQNEARTRTSFTLKLCHDTIAVVNMAAQKIRSFMSANTMHSH